MTIAPESIASVRGEDPPLIQIKRSAALPFLLGSGLSASGRSNAKPTVSGAKLPLQDQEQEGGRPDPVYRRGRRDRYHALERSDQPEGARTEQDIADVFRHARDGGQLLPLRGLKNAILGVAEVGTKRY